MEFSDVKYAAFEGGGGKGIVYLGAARALEAVDLLPLSKAKRLECPNAVLTGVSGASAGAITAYFLCLGMSADAISVESKQFSTFYDEGQPALYKGVKYYPDRGNVPVYIVDVPDVERTNRSDPSQGTLSIASRISALRTGQAYTDENRATVAADKMYRLYKFVYPLGFLKLMMRLVGTLKKLQKAGKTNQAAAKVSASRSELIKFFYSLLFDRGAFSGIKIRAYLQDLAISQLHTNFDIDISNDAAARLTFAQFYQHTGNDLRIAATNITRGVPVYFSKDLSPDFPVVEAVCMSMSIPLAFKPTLSTALADISRQEDLTHNNRYIGFFNDGGVLNNLPIHAFDFKPGDDNFMKKVVTMNAQMFGIRCSSGYPADGSEDPKFSNDANYARYLGHLNEGRSAEEKIDPKDVGNKASSPFQFEMIYGLLTPLLRFVGDVYNTFMYYSEDGQIRSVDEFKQTMELYAYDVGLFDFEVFPALSDFVQARAAIKVGAMLGIDQQVIRDTVTTHYYKSEKDASKIAEYITHSYDYIRKYKEQHGIVP